jgi:acetate kinase
MEKPRVLTVNGGSSSIKFALFEGGEETRRVLEGRIERIGLPGSRLIFSGRESGVEESQEITAPNHKAAASLLLDSLEERLDFSAVRAVGHRIVHGMDYDRPEVVTPGLLEGLRRIAPFDPEHMPSELELVEEFGRRLPGVLQLACFDTSFHRTMPKTAKILPIPRRYYSLGVKRYGFHGLSCSFIMEELARQAGESAAAGRVIIAHLGNGASLTAVRGGESIDTSMGFTPAGGIPMGTRPGDLDPGAAWFMMAEGKMTPKRFNALINHESGLLGISETSPDMKDLLDLQESDPRAAEAVDVFCYQAKKTVGALAAALGGVDTLVFTGGIGIRSPEIRSRICAGLVFLGLWLDEDKNAAGEPLISAADARVKVRVIKTDEELVIAKALFTI